MFLLRYNPHTMKFTLLEYMIFFGLNWNIFTELCSHHQAPIQNMLIATKELLSVVTCSAFGKRCIWIYLYRTFRVNRFIQHVAFCVWLFSLTDACKVPPCYSMNPFYGWIMLHCVDITFLGVYSSVDRRHYDCSHLWAIMNSTTVNIHMHGFMWTCVFIWGQSVYLGVEWLGHMVTLCLTFWGIAKLFPKAACTIFYSHQQYVRVPVYPHLPQLVLLTNSLYFFILAILVGMELCLLVVLMCIS